MTMVETVVKKHLLQQLLCVVIFILTAATITTTATPTTAAVAAYATATASTATKTSFLMRAYCNTIVDGVTAAAAAASSFHVKRPAWKSTSSSRLSFSLPLSSRTVAFTTRYGSSTNIRKDFIATTSTILPMILHHHHHHHHHHHIRHQSAKSSSSSTTAPVRSRSSTCRNSVTGIVYSCDNSDKNPSIQLFTKDGCTLCDKVKDILLDVRTDYPHSLQQIDITDDTNKHWYDRYKYDIPVLHINGIYWTKHRLTVDEVIRTFQLVQHGTFKSPLGEPNASKYERP